MRYKQGVLSISFLIFVSFHAGQEWSSDAFQCASKSPSVSSLLPWQLFSNRRLSKLHASAKSTVSTMSPALSLTRMGMVEVDMNEYNLSEESIPEEWTANLQAATEMNEAGVFLGAKNSKENFVDIIKVILPFPQTGQGLGIELLELAGGRPDGLGITIVSGLVPGKCAEFSGLLFGDSISQISLRRRKRSKDEGKLMELDEIKSVSTECLAYDGTIDAIVSLLQDEGAANASDADDEEIALVFTVKRLRRKPKVKVLLQYPPSQNEPDLALELFSGENLRRALLVRGVKLNDPLARRFDNGGTGDCGAEGTCATCVVNVVKGGELLNRPKESESQIVTNRNPRWRMACKAIVGHGMQEGEMIVRVSPKQWAPND
ncbi:hypothetical protein ACA910_005330 [Epithemia clementina (nom. ined.)]